MWYSIVGQDVDDGLEKRQQARPAHIERLQALTDAGRLLVAGPNPAIDSEDPGPAGFSGSIIIADFESLQDAESWAAADPYIAAGVYRDVVVKPFKLALP